LSLLDAIPAAVANLFDVNRPHAARDRHLRMWLLAIIVAGAILRFWGLGDVGLHREDEDTSALPVRALIATGEPVYPGGMYYARALVQTYLMAGSVSVFGDTEWALRLPSALCGTLLILLAWLMGRRFLQPRWNLVFAAVIAFLPALIQASQTARMYIFLLACLAAFAVFIFRWEHHDRLGDFLWSYAIMWLAIQFHTLAVFAALLYLYPSLLHGDAKRWWLGLLGIAGSYFAYEVVNHWLGQYYPQSVVQNFAVRPPVVGPTAAAVAPHMPWSMLTAAAVVGIALATWIASRVRGGWPALVTAALTMAAFAAQVVPAYHVAMLLWLSAAVMALRHGQRVGKPLLLALAAAAALAALQAAYLHTHGVPALRNIIGVMVGWPGVWIYARLADYSTGAALACAVLIAVGLGQLIRNRPVPDMILWLVLGGWIPVLAVGFFVWNPPPRYTMMALLPMLMAAVFVVQWAALGIRREGGPVLLACALLALVDPVTFARTYHAGYRIHPDHKGAAQYVLSQHPGPRDILVAEDAIVQRYYLPRLDYWLMARESVVDFVTRRDNGEVRDIYTNSRIIGNGADLQTVIDKPDRGAIYIIGSGENQEDGRRQMRGPELAARLASGEFPVVYTGRDGLTRVWKIPPPATP
jgi:hypothetical protein